MTSVTTIEVGAAPEAIEEEACPEGEAGLEEVVAGANGGGATL